MKPLLHSAIVKLQLSFELRLLNRYSQLPQSDFFDLRSSRMGELCFIGIAGWMYNGIR